MTTEGDQILAFIRAAVAQLNVPVEHRQAVTEAAARTVIAVYSNPMFLNHLAIVVAQREEINALQHQVVNLQAFIHRYVNANPPTVRKKAPAKKKAVAKNPAVKVRGSTPANRRAFKQGYRGR